MPWAQTEQIQFTSFPLTFPLSISPNGIVLVSGIDDLITETTLLILVTEAGIDITTETAFDGVVTAMIPAYIVPTSFLWSWQSGGAGIFIDSPTALSTGLETTNALATGVLLLTVTSSLGGVATATINVSA